MRLATREIKILGLKQSHLLVYILRNEISDLIFWEIIIEWIYRFKRRNSFGLSIHSSKLVRGISFNLR